MVDGDRGTMDQAFRGYVERGVVPGLVVGVARTDGAEVKAYGRSGTTRPLDERSLLEIGSVTKTFTALLLAEMASRSEVRLEDPIGTYLPSGVRTPKRSGREITLADLATHTARLPRSGGTLIRRSLRNRTQPLADYSYADLYDAVVRTGIRPGIGEKVRYSNLGFGLLGHILGLAGSKPYQELITERVCRPLGLEDTSATTVGPRLTSGHSRKGRRVPPLEIDTLAGAGVLRSSARDMVRYLQAHLRPETTPLAEPLELVQGTHRDIRKGKLAIGLAWMILDKDGRRTLWHNGGTGGFGAFAGFQRGTSLGLVVLYNSRYRLRMDRAAFRALDGLGAWAREESLMEQETTKTDKEWRKQLSPEQYRVLRQQGTEPPFSHEYAFTKDHGMYRCAACGADLFRSDAKFDSGTGWPSFTEPAVAEAVELRPDRSHGMVRTEVVCRRCGSHLGHVFDDGPGPRGQRYCINGVCLLLQREDTQP